MCKLAVFKCQACKGATACTEPVTIYSPKIIIICKNKFELVLVYNLECISMQSTVGCHALMENTVLWRLHTLCWYTLACTGPTECQDGATNDCTQTCTRSTSNETYYYECGCNDGYKLNSDYTTCDGKHAWRYRIDWGSFDYTSVQVQIKRNIIIVHAEKLLNKSYDI